VFTETSSVTDWRDLQSRVGALFQEMGYNVSIEQSRRLANGGIAKIDIVAEDPNASIARTYFFECKHWDRAVDRQTVQSFKMDVHESGANFGVFVSKKGYQKGADSATKYTNVTLLSFASLQHTFGNEWYRKNIDSFANEYQFLNSLFQSSLRDGGWQKAIFDRLVTSDDSRCRAENLKNGIIDLIEICIENKPLSYQVELNVSTTIPKFPSVDLRSSAPVTVTFDDSRSYVNTLRPLCRRLRSSFDIFLEDINSELFSLPPEKLAFAMSGRIVASS